MRHSTFLAQQWLQIKPKLCNIKYFYSTSRPAACALLFITPKNIFTKLQLAQSETITGQSSEN